MGFHHPSRMCHHRLRALLNVSARKALCCHGLRRRTKSNIVCMYVCMYMMFICFLRPPHQPHFLKCMRVLHLRPRPHTHTNTGFQPTRVQLLSTSCSASLVRPFLMPTPWFQINSRKVKFAFIKHLIFFQFFFLSY